MLPVAMAIQHGAQLLRRHVAFMLQRQYFEDPFNENGAVLSYDKNRHLPQNYKKQSFLGKVQKEPEKNGKKETNRVVRA